MATPARATLEPTAGLGEAAAERPFAPVQLPGGLRLGEALQVAEEDRQAVLLGQPGDLLVQRRQQVVQTAGLDDADAVVL